MVRSSRWMPLAATIAAAAALTGAALMTVERAGCTDPGTWVIRPSSVELVGGCLDGEELPAAPPRLPPDRVDPAGLQLGD